jgi:UDP-N-acetyl-D-galactosamine dehydrogenase
MGYDAEVILAGRNINDNMAKYVARNVIQHIIRNTADVKAAKVLVKGATFKENVSDIRNSKVADVVKALKSYYVNVDVEDPHADSDALQHEYGFGLTSQPGNDYDAVIVTVPHREYTALDDAYFISVTKPNGLVADLKGMYRDRIRSRNYWSL